MAYIFRPIDTSIRFALARWSVIFVVVFGFCSPAGAYSESVLRHFETIVRNTTIDTCAQIQRELESTGLNYGFDELLAWSIQYQSDCLYKLALRHFGGCMDMERLCENAAEKGFHAGLNRMALAHRDAREKDGGEYNAWLIAAHNAIALGAFQNASQGQMNLLLLSVADLCYLNQMDQVILWAIRQNGNINFPINDWRHSETHRPANVAIPTHKVTARQIISERCPKLLKTIDNAVFTSKRSPD